MENLKYPSHKGCFRRKTQNPLIKHCLYLPPLSFPSHMLSVLGLLGLSWLLGLLGLLGLLRLLSLLPLLGLQRAPLSAHIDPRVGFPGKEYENSLLPQSLLPQGFSVTGSTRNCPVPIFRTHPFLAILI